MQNQEDAYLKIKRKYMLETSEEENEIKLNQQWLQVKLRQQEMATPLREVLTQS